MPLTQQVEPSDFYDLIIVTVRLDQLESVIKVLKQNTVCPLIMFMLNNPDNMEHLINELSPQHIVLGCPGAGGTYHDNGIDYIQIKQQKATIGEMDSKISNYTKEIKVFFGRAGFETVITANMQAWLKTHDVFVACISASVIKENGSSNQLSKNKRSIQMMVKSIGEGFSALPTPTVFGILSFDNYIINTHNCFQKSLRF